VFTALRTPIEAGDAIGIKAGLATLFGAITGN
jgi:hypothetical protein